jgi:rod shape-determining protein MreC
MTTLSLRQTFALVVLFVVTSLTFIQLDNRQALDPAKSLLNGIIAPVTDAFDEVGSGDQSALEQELERMRAENDALIRENAELKTQTREIEQLREQAGLRIDHAEWQLLDAEVISPDPANQSKFITIDKGSNDGVREGMAVVARRNNYIGQVIDVDPDRARVMLIIDETQRVGARLESGADGIVRGMWQRGQRLVLEYVNRDIEVKLNEVVLTADNATISTNMVPGGLIIGRVEAEPVLNPQSDSQSIRVLPLVDFDQLSVVTVVLSADGA